MIDNNMMFGVNEYLAGISSSLRSVSAIYEDTELMVNQVAESITVMKMALMDSVSNIYSIQSVVNQFRQSMMNVWTCMEYANNATENIRNVLNGFSEFQMQLEQLSLTAMQSIAAQLESYNMDFTMNEEDFQDCMGLDESMQMEQDITEILTSDSNDIFNKVEEKFKKWGQQHPRLAKVFGFILLYLIIPYIFTAACNKGVSKLCTRLYDKPASKSNVIVVIPEKVSVEILEDVKYYYKVTYYDSENDTEYEGYLSKRSIERE